MEMYKHTLKLRPSTAPTLIQHCFIILPNCDFAFSKIQACIREQNGGLRFDMQHAQWRCCAMVLGKLPVPGRPTIWITVGQGPTALAVGAGGSCLDIFTLVYPFSLLSPSLWETARYRLKYCLKGPLNPKQPTNCE